MDNILLTIISVVIGIIATHYYTKKQMAKNQISHFAIRSFNLAKGMREIFPDFQMVYQGKSLTKYARVCQGCFRNTGNKDIHNNDGLDFSLIFPEEYVVKAIKVFPSTDDLIIHTQIDENSNKVNFVINELIRTGEEFKYTVILESSEYLGNPFGHLSFSNRIPDTSILEADVKHVKLYRRFSSFGFLTTLLLMILILFSWKKHLLTNDVLLYVFIICTFVIAALSVVAYLKSVVKSLYYFE